MKILIGCPTHKIYKPLLAEYLDCAKKLERPGFEIDVVLVDNSEDDEYLETIKASGITALKGPWSESAKERIVLSREMLRQRCLDAGYDYFFSLEQDVMVKPDTLKRLLGHDMPIVSAYYGDNTPLVVKDSQTGKTRQVILNIPLIYLQTRPGYIKRANAHEVLHKGLIEIGAAGIGCMLIRRDVLEKVPFRLNPGKGFDDVLFCKEAKAAGYKICVDSDVILEHRHRDWKEMGIKR
ncbi:hypothetical protein JW826_03865 [Candidatus Woesearchaeota archaeon]|nr:hypothetical protein [Candidatus Woesearchaeota archaeon]